MNHKSIIDTYFKALQKGDSQELLTIFDENAMVHSPLYGKMSAKQFFTLLFTDTAESKITLLHTFSSSESSTTCAGHFQYDWTMKDDTLVSFQCVDVFKISDTNKIECLTIIYDTFGVRDNFNQLRNE